MLTDLKPRFLRFPGKDEVICFNSSQFRLCCFEHIYLLDYFDFVMQASICNIYNAEVHRLNLFTSSLYTWFIDLGTYFVSASFHYDCNLYNIHYLIGVPLTVGGILRCNQVEFS